jgi:hypothetical protein
VLEIGNLLKLDAPLPADIEVVEFTQINYFRNRIMLGQNRLLGLRVSIEKRGPSSGNLPDPSDPHRAPLVRARWERFSPLGPLNW